jgi:hypothetical protein
MTYEGQTTHGGRVVNAPDSMVQTRFFPRNTASIISNLELKVNGVSRFNLPDYNFVYNILHDYTQGGDTLKRRQTGGENADPSCKKYIVGNDIIERRGYSMGVYNEAVPNQEDNDVGLDKQKYTIRSWIGPLGGNCSTNIIDSNILGVTTVELTLAPASMLMLGFTPVANVNGIADADSGPFRQQVGRLPFGVGIAAGAALDAQPVGYSIKDVDFTIVRYHMPTEFYIAEANALANGAVYKLWYPNYSVFTGNAVPAANKASTHRFSISTKSLDYVLGTFRLPDYTTPGLPLNSVISDNNNSIFIGETRATFDSQVSAGVRRAFNQSKYFAHNGDSIVNCKWKLGFTEFPPQTLDEQYNSLLQHFNQHQDTIGGMYPGLNSIGAFRETFYAHVLSCNIPGESEMYTVSGVDTQETPAVIEWNVTSAPYGVSDIIPLNSVATPYLIACDNSHLEIRAGRVVSTIS